MPKKILFIVAGPRAEPDFIRRLYHCMQPSFHDYVFYEYTTTLHRLADRLFDDDLLDEDIDLLLELSAFETDQDKKALLRMKYTDIYMVFDFEPHHEPAFFEKIRRMLGYYNDSANYGKLFINYPMMQSYKHFPCLPDPSFADREIDFEDAFHYKQLVEQEAMDELKDLRRYAYETFVSLAVHHLKKINKILNGRFSIPLPQTFLSLDMIRLFDKQRLKHTRENKISVVNTCILMLVDYNPRAFLASVYQRRNQYRI